MKCHFCDKEIELGTGVTYSTKEGNIYHFCSSKCQKNALSLKRKPQKVQWTGRYKAEKDIRLHGKQVNKKEDKEHVKERVKKKTTKKERREVRQAKKDALKAKKKKASAKPKEE